MKNTEKDEQILERFRQWGENQPLVRAMILTSTKAVPNSTGDLFSDYDVILALREVQPFYEDRDWLGAFGRVLVLYRDPLEAEYGYPKSGYVIQFEDGLKIDFTLWSTEILQKIIAEPELQPELDAGYRVLLDKDHLTEGLKSPTYKSYIPTPPTETQYQAEVETFFLETTYVAKLLWRDDLMAMKYLLDYCMKQEHLRPMLEWRVEIEHGWSVKPGPYGRGLKKWVRPDLWAELENTYTGPGLEDNWEAMYKTITLFRKVALEVSKLLGYTYPHDLDRRTMDYLQKVKKLDREAESFS